MTPCLFRSTGLLSRLLRDRRGSMIVDYGMMTAVLILGVVGATRAMDLALDDLIGARLENAASAEGYDYPLDGIDFSDVMVWSHGSGRDRGTYELSDEGRTFTVSNNGWKSAQADIEILPETVMTFNFSSEIEGKIHAIAIGDGAAQHEQRAFQVFGTDVWGIQAVNGRYTAGTGLLHYSIPVGQYFTGNANRIAFMLEQDIGSGANAVFSNIQFWD